MSAYITPPVGWVDLRSVATNPVTIATGLGLGLHDYSYDVAINDLVNASNTAVLAAEGLNLQNRSTAGTVCLVHAAACSMALDPTLEIVFKHDTVFRGGVATEIVCEDPAVVSGTDNITYGVSCEVSGNVAILHRFSVYSALTAVLTSGKWYRYTVTNMAMQAVHTFHELPSGSPADWDDASILSGSYSDTNASIAGGNVAVPYLHVVNGTDNSDIAAVRMMPRRTL